MSGHDGMPERRLDPRPDDASWAIKRPEPRSFTCSCGARAWRFPEQGLGFCGFCPASRRDLAERAAARETLLMSADRDDFADEYSRNVEEPE